jgi:DNA-binding Lrp family transcriptional regulator
MELTRVDRSLLDEIQNGLPLVHRPYALIGARIGLEEAAVMARLRALMESGIIKRLGVVVRHHELGYRANAMTVWDIADEGVQAVAARMLRNPALTLCYRRPRRLPDWPYNLFCMIHGRHRDEVLAQIEALKQECDLQDCRHAVLFSTRRFKQCGAHYPLTARTAVAQHEPALVAHG